MIDVLNPSALAKMLVIDLGFGSSEAGDEDRAAQRVVAAMSGGVGRSVAAGQTRRL